MKSVNIIITLLLISVVSAFCQQGDLFITNYLPEGKADPSANFDLVQRPDGIIIIANRSGLLEYDGQGWEVYSSSGTPLSLIAGEDGLYAGGGFGVGFQPYKNPSSFIKVHSDSLVKNILQIERAGSDLIAIENKKVHVFSTSKKQYSYSVPFDQGYLKKILIINGQPIISTSAGNFLLSDQSMGFAENIPYIELAFSAHFDGYDIVGTNSGELYKVAEGVWQKIDIDVNGFEKSVADIEFIDAVRVNDRLAVNTLNSGVIIINISELEIERVIDHHNGLPDSETYFIASDFDGGIWVGHEFGLSRIATNLPLETFSHFPGLDGKLLNASHHNNTLYVGTSTGLYKLDEVRDFSEVINYVKKTRTVNKIIEKDGEKPKGLFNFLRRRGEVEQDTLIKETKVSYEKQVSRELKSIRYIFREVKGIEAKVIRQVSTQDELLIATLRGLYSLKGNIVEQISRDPVKLLWTNKKEDFIIANTYNGHLLSYRKKAGGQWYDSHYFEGYEDNIMDIYQDSAGRIWLASEDEIYYITYDKENIYPGREFRYNNPFLDPTYISENATDEVVFNNRFGKWKYDEHKKEIISEPVDSQVRSFLKGNNSLWMRTEDEWHSLSFPINNNWLNVFDNATFLSADYIGDFIYIITSSNELYKIPAKNQQVKPAKQPRILLRMLTENDNKLISGNQLRINQKQNDFAFEFVQPEYTGLMNIKYKYRIKGLTETWTEWAPQNNRINLNYLPEGNFTLELMAKTALGEELSSDPVFIEVVPPYWKRPWFYAFEFTLLGLLLLLTIYLNHNSKRYLLLNKLLAFLTLIIIIEFIQVTAESYFETDISPIIGFFIQVTVALTVLPVEGFLRRLIMKDKKLKLPLYLRLKR